MTVISIARPASAGRRRCSSPSSSRRPTLAAAATGPASSGPSPRSSPAASRPDGDRVHGRRHDRRPSRHAVQGANDGFIRRYNRAGTVLWTRQFGTGAQDMATTSPRTAAASPSSARPTARSRGGRDARHRRHVRPPLRPGRQAPLDPPVRDGGRRGRGRDRGRRRRDHRRRDDPGPCRHQHARRSRRLRPPLRPPGHVVWTRQFGTTEATRPTRSPSTAAASSAAAPTATSGKNAGPFTDMFVRRYNAAGNVVWTRQWGQKGDDQVLSIAADCDRRHRRRLHPRRPEGNESSQAFIRRYDRDGAPAWSKIFGSPDSEVAWGVAADCGRDHRDGLHVR